MSQRVCCLGPEATYCHTAAIRHFGDQAEYVMAKSISLVFQAVERGEAEYGVVPIENSIEGSVGMSLDGFTRTSCRIVGEVILEIVHNLLSRETVTSAITQVYSHPQALAQCRDWLARHLPDADVIPLASTAAAAQHAASEWKVAAVGGALLGERYGLNVLADHIQDAAVNFTRFLVLGSTPPTPTAQDRTSLMIALAHEPGALFHCLRHFAESGVNLTHIESRPRPDTPFEYTFFVDLEGHVDSPQIAEALTHVRQHAHNVTVLGAYPRVDAPVPSART